MPQSVSVSIGIFERDIAEFNTVFIIIAFFNRQRAAVHGIWNVKIRKEAFHISMVDERQLNRTGNSGNSGEQKHNT